MQKKNVLYNLVNASTEQYSIDGKNCIMYLPKNIAIFIFYWLNEGNPFDSAVQFPIYDDGHWKFKLNGVVEKFSIEFYQQGELQKTLTITTII